jgi:hypothetical protein
MGRALIVMVVAVGVTSHSGRTRTTKISPCYWVDAIGQEGHSWKLMGGFGPEPERRSSGSAQEIVATVNSGAHDFVSATPACFAASTSQGERPAACKSV